MRRMIIAAAAATLGLGALVGCGGGGEDSGNAQGGNEQSQQSGQDEQGNGETGDDTGGDTGESDGADSETEQDDSAQSSGNVSAYCDAAKTMGTTMEETTPEKGAEKARAALQDIVDNAPTDAKDHWTTYMEAWDELSDATEAMEGGPSGADLKEAEKKAKSAQTKMESVSEPIEKHLKSNCGEV